MLKYNVIRTEHNMVHFYTRDTGIWTADPSRARQFPVYELATRIAERLGGGAMVVLATRPLSLDTLHNVLSRAVSVIEMSDNGEGMDAHASLIAELRDIAFLCGDVAMTDGVMTLREGE